MKKIEIGTENTLYYDFDEMFDGIIGFDWLETTGGAPCTSEDDFDGAEEYREKIREMIASETNPLECDSDDYIQLCSELYGFGIISEEEYEKAKAYFEDGRRTLYDIFGREHVVIDAHNDAYSTSTIELDTFPNYSEVKQIGTTTLGALKSNEDTEYLAEIIMREEDEVDLEEEVEIYEALWTLGDKQERLNIYVPESWY